MVQFNHQYRDSSINIGFLGFPALDFRASKAGVLPLDEPGKVEADCRAVAFLFEGRSLRPFLFPCPSMLGQRFEGLKPFLS